MSHHPLSRWRSCSSCLFSQHKCFRNSPQTGWIVSLGYEQTAWLMRQVGKDSAMKKKRRKALFLAFRMELGHKGNFVNHASFVIRMVEDNYFVLCLIWVNQLLIANWGFKNFPDMARQNQLTSLDKEVGQFWLENQVRWGTRLPADMALVWKDTLVQDLKFCLDDENFMCAWEIGLRWVRLGDSGEFTIFNHFVLSH